MEYIITKAIRDHKDSKVITSESSDHIWLRALLVGLFTAIAFVAGKERRGPLPSSSPLRVYAVTLAALKLTVGEDLHHRNWQTVQIRCFMWLWWLFYFKIFEAQVIKPLPEHLSVQFLPWWNS